MHRSLLLGVLIACGTAPEENCGNEVFIQCVGDACVCDGGPADGEACSTDEADADSPDHCDTLCAQCILESAGPPSVLLGS